VPLGHIEPRKLTAREKYLATLVYPQNKAVIWHLSRMEFRKWLIGLNPRDALLLTCLSDGHALVHYQQSKSWYHEVKDWVWRSGLWEL
jgi:hypothetical protein